MRARVAVVFLLPAMMLIGPFIVMVGSIHGPGPHSFRRRAEQRWIINLLTYVDLSIIWQLEYRADIK